MYYNINTHFNYSTTKRFKDTNKKYKNCLSSLNFKKSFFSFIIIFTHEFIGLRLNLLKV